MSGDQREILTYQLFEQAVRELAQAIVDDGYEPDIILSIARGGLFVAGGLGYALGVKNLYVMNIEFYEGVGKTLDMPVMLPPLPNAVDFSEKRILVADDVADTGQTLKLVHDFCADHAAEVRSAVIYEKPASLVTCEYVWKTTDLWINFPWSVDKPVPAAGARFWTPEARSPFCRRPPVRTQRAARRSPCLDRERRDPGIPRTLTTAVRTTHSTGFHPGKHRRASSAPGKQHTRRARRPAGFSPLARRGPYEDSSARPCRTEGGRRLPSHPAVGLRDRDAGCSRSW